MNAPIYFPYFEPQNERWLKYALLYLDAFKPIIPIERRELISDKYKQILDHTNLIKPYSPNYDDGAQASIKTIEDIEKFLSQPRLYHHLFHGMGISELMQKETCNYLLFREKFSWDFLEFCTSNKFGKFVEGGIMLPEQVAFIYMRNLANRISKSTHSYIITDNHSFSNLDNYYSLHNEEVKNNFLLAENTINLILPRDIDNISIETLIKFRNENMDLILAFNKHLNSMESQISSLGAGDIVEMYQVSSLELLAKIGLIGGVAISMPLSFYSVFDSSMSSIGYLKETLLGVSATCGLGLQFGSISKSDQEKKCIKYFANLKDIK